MRIAYVCGDLGIPLAGSKGASVHVRELVRAFDELGHTVRVLTPRVDGPSVAELPADVVAVPPQDEDEEVVELVRGDTGAGPVVARDLRALLYVRAFRRRVCEVLREFEPDFVYERHTLFGSAGRGAASELGVPLVLEVNAPLAEEQAAHRGLVLQTVAWKLESEALLSADHIATVSTVLEKWLVQLGVDKQRILVLPNGVDVDRFADAATEGRRLRRELAAGTEALVGFAGSLKPWHDVEALVEAVARLRRERRDARLVVIGEGPQREALEHRARQADVPVTFTGVVPHARVPGYLGALDVAVAPYAAQGTFYYSPLKLFEYMASGVPVVAADVGDIHHCVRDGETGWLYPPGDVEALASALAAVLANPAAAVRIAVAGREHVRAKHTWHRIARQVTQSVAPVGSSAR
jgi:glycosyltransferase involved in cell wall biosynthesis